MASTSLMPDDPVVRINMAIVGVLIALLVAVSGGLVYVYKAGQATEATSSRITAIETTLTEGDKTRADRRADLSSTIGSILTRMSAVEDAARTANNTTDRLTTRVATTEASMASTNAQMSRFSDALGELSKQQAVTNALLAEIKDQLKGIHDGPA